MSESEIDYSSGATASDAVFGETGFAPAETYEDEAGYSDEELSSAYDVVDAEDDYADEGPALPTSLEELVADAMRRGLSSGEAMLEARQRSDEWWQAYQQRTEYETYVDQRAAFVQANEEADDIIEQASRRHNVEASGRDGTVRQAANQLLAQAQREAYDLGDEQTLAFLRSPEGARTAIEAGAEAAFLHRFGQLAHQHRGTGPLPDEENQRHLGETWRAHEDRERRRNG